MSTQTTAQTLAEMIEYQKGTVVSKTLINKSAGTVTLFAFDKGEGLSEHAAPYDAMVQILEGEVEIKISGTPFHLKKGDMIVMPGNEPHALQSITEFKMLLTMIKA